MVLDVSVPTRAKFIEIQSTEVDESASDGRLARVSRSALRRRRAVVRVLRLHEDDGSFDREFWRKAPPSKRLEMVWELSLECWRWMRPDEAQPRLQRSLCRLRRRRR
jgi:hypothetical protein